MYQSTLVHIFRSWIQVEKDLIFWLTDHTQGDQTGVHPRASLALIEEGFKRLRNEDLFLILERNDISGSYSVKVKVKDVYPRWCTCVQKVVQDNKVNEVTYTIQYVDILQAVNSKSTNRYSKIPKVIIEGVNPFA